MTDKTLNKWVTQYCDPTVPQEVINEAVESIKTLHEEGKIAYNEEAVYYWMKGKKPYKGEYDPENDEMLQIKADMDDDSGEEEEL